MLNEPCPFSLLLQDFGLFYRDLCFIWSAVGELPSKLTSEKPSMEQMIYKPCIIVKVFWDHNSVMQETAQKYVDNHIINQ